MRSEQPLPNPERVLVVQARPRELAALGVVLLLGVYLQLPDLLVPWRPEQAALHAAAADLARLPATSPPSVPRGAWYRLLLLLFGWFGESLLLPRLLTAALGAVATTATWILARRWFSGRPALLVAALMAWSPLSLGATASGSLDAALVLLPAVALVVPMFLLDVGIERERRAWIGAAGGGLGAGLYLVGAQAWPPPGGLLGGGPSSPGGAAGNPVVLAAMLLGMGWAGWRARGPRAATRRRDRLLGAWVLAGLVAATVLALAAGTPAAKSDPAARRALQVLVPVPWLAVGLLLDELKRLPPRWRRAQPAAVLLLLGTAFAVPFSGAPGQLRPGAGYPVLEAGRVLLAERIALVEQQTGRAPRVRVDAPPGDARHWGAVRFAVASGDLGLTDAERRDAVADPRWGRLLDQRQSVYEAQPPDLRLAVVLDRLRTIEVAVGGPVLPPLEPVLKRSDPTGPRRTVLIGISNSEALEVQAAALPGVTLEPPDRLARFEVWNPTWKPIVTSPGLRGGRGFGIYQLELAPRRWRELDLAFGAPADVDARPRRVWALPNTLHRVELGYGWNHGFVVATRSAPGPGVRAELPVELRVDVVNGPVAGTLGVGYPCGADLPPITVQGQELSTADTRCEEWGAQDLRFCVEVPDGRLRLRVGARGGVDGLSVHRLQLAAVGSCPAPLQP